MTTSVRPPSIPYRPHFSMPIVARPPMPGGSSAALATSISAIVLPVADSLVEAGGRLTQIWEKAVKVTKIFTATTGFLTGAANFIIGASKGYWLAKRVSFHRGLQKEIKAVNSTAEKASKIWKCFSLYLNIDPEKIEKGVYDFDAPHKGESCDVKQKRQVKTLQKEYQSELSRIGDTFTDLSFRIKSSVYNLFNKQYPAKNLAAEKRALIREERDALVYKLMSAPPEQHESILKEGQRTFLENRAKRTQVVALQRIVAPAFAQEVAAVEKRIDLKSPEHQKALVDLHARIYKNYTSNLLADVGEIVCHLGAAALSVVSVTAVKTLAIRMAATAVGALTSIRPFYDITQTIRRLLGAELPKTFAQDIHDICDRFKKATITPISIAHSIANDSDYASEEEEFFDALETQEG